MPISGHAGLDGQVHDLDDLLTVDLAEGAAEDCAVLGEYAHLAAVNGAVAGDDAVADGRLASSPKLVRAVAGERVELDEGSLVEQLLDALARGELIFLMHPVDRSLTHGGLGFGQARPQIR